MDVIEGRMAPSLVLALVQRLPDDSMTHAIARGGRDHFGWGAERHLLADIFDAINVNTKATGQWKKGKQPDFPTWPRPTGTTAEAAATKPRVRVRDLYRKFSGR